ncbi:ABC transporter substrate-binding protein [Paenibacillus sp. MMS18-CY102]|uniref:ABC transporter substrate-binding protein n=1 Tax=Paenibacillus sp. MMS18-CY102 TaxID=2682849 RepID=UPI0013659938|nr:extracellular solute-binding protein [Paenibacillus sp. MMS18-CY102]MWC28556.1 extracellular solute-binding protein [Paenibacillus sp. MMS18-CY102]
MVKRTLLTGTLVMALVSSMLIGCQSARESGLESESGEKEALTLKIVDFNKLSFESWGGEDLRHQFPQIRFEVVPIIQGETGLNQHNKMKPASELLEESQPDILVLSQYEYEKLSGEGKLLELDPLIKQDNYDMEGFVPIVTDFLRTAGKGKMYGLSPTFAGSGIIYNKDLFDRYNIPYPSEAMSKEELFQLVKRFPVDGQGNERIFGYLSNSAGVNALMSQIIYSGHMEGLSAVDPTGKTMQISSPEWRRIFQMVLDAASSKAWLDEGFTDLMKNAKDMRIYDWFPSGRVAMTSTSYQDLLTLQAYWDSHPNVKPFKYGLTRSPVDPANPDTGNSVSLNFILAINAKSPNVDAAWDVIRYVTGEQWAAKHAKTFYQLSSRSAYVTLWNGVSLLPFYEGQRIANRYDEPYELLPEGFIDAWVVDAEKELQNVMNKKATLDEAIKAIEELGRMRISTGHSEGGNP